MLYANEHLLPLPRYTACTIKAMSPRHKGFFYRFRFPLRILLVILLICGAGALGYMLSQLGPRDVSVADFKAQQLDERELLEITSEATALQRRYEAATRLRPATATDIDLLKEARDRLEAAYESTGGTNRQLREALNEARRLYQVEQAELMIEESRNFEIQAGRIASEDPKAQTQLLSQAVNLQERINQDFPLSPHKNVARLQRLARQRDMLKAEPLYQQSLEAEAKAREAIEANAWDVAAAHLLEAIDIQKQLNMRYTGLRFTSRKRVTQLETELVSLESGQSQERIAELEAAGLAFMETQSYRQAASAFRKAIRLQQQLNEEHPNSRYAGADKLEQFEVLEEMALGTELAESIKAELVQLEENLLARQVWEATEQIQNLHLKMKQFAETYPRNQALQSEDISKIDFLNAMRGDLALLQDRIYDQLVPVPDGEGWHLSKTEVSQALYESIMQRNPSRNDGPRYPVDSVNWDEAHAFCQRVAWLLARPVRLPRREEFDRAIGSLRYVDLDTISWNQQNSDGLAHEVGTKAANNAGFHDLLGNVAEWLEPGSSLGEAEAYVAGGDAETSIDALIDRPVEIVNRRTRNRLYGFRIAVEMPL